MSKNAKKRDVVKDRSFGAVKVPAVKTSEWREKNAKRVQDRLIHHVQRAIKGRQCSALGSAIVKACLSKTGDSRHFGQ